MSEHEHKTLTTKVQLAKLYQDENLHLAIEINVSCAITLTK